MYRPQESDLEIWRLEAGTKSKSFFNRAGSWAGNKNLINLYMKKLVEKMFQRVYNEQKYNSDEIYFCPYILLYSIPYTIQYAREGFLSMALPESGI